MLLFSGSSDILAFFARFIGNSLALSEPSSSGLLRRGDGSLGLAGVGEEGICKFLGADATALGVKNEVNDLCFFSEGCDDGGMMRIMCWLLSTCHIAHIKLGDGRFMINYLSTEYTGDATGRVSCSRDALSTSPHYSFTVN